MVESQIPMGILSLLSKDIPALDLLYGDQNIIDPQANLTVKRPPDIKKLNSLPNEEPVISPST